MRSQGDGELVQHRKTDQNQEDVEEDEDEEYGVRRSVKKLGRFATGADTA